jgi:hypothetical protein
VSNLQKGLNISQGSKTHIWLAHVNTGLFEGQPFPCPQCIRQRMREQEVERIKDRISWDDPVERVDGGIQTLAGEAL